MKMTKWLIAMAGIIGLALVATSLERRTVGAQQSKASGGSDRLVVQLCDGETKLEIAEARAGEVLPPEKAREVARRMMAAYAEQQAKQVSKWTARDRLGARAKARDRGGV